MLTRWRNLKVGLVILFILASCNSVAKPDPNAIKPSKPGGTGEALRLNGLADQGELVFNSKCKECHGEAGQGGILNPGVESGEVPALNPIDASLYNSDAKVFAANIDLFIEHGSTPEGTNPKNVMDAWGDNKKLTPQQIADVIAYIIALNKQ